MTEAILIWYRNDLRIHDHEPLDQAVNAKVNIIPFYCFDNRQFGTTSYGFPKTGKFRTKFLLESIADLRYSLQQLGSNLIIRCGIPEKIIPELAKQYNITGVYYHSEVTAEETRVETKLKMALASLGISLKAFWGHTLYHPHDLPFSIQELPEVFTAYRKKVEYYCNINPTFPTPQTLPALPNINPGTLPRIADFNLETPLFNSRAVLKFQGGETAGKARLEHYFWQENCLKSYKETRNGMLGADFSTKFSPWLALGCLSPRYIYEQVQLYEEQRIKNDSTYWLIFELLWRDYFRFICAKHGNKIFHSAGLQGIAIPWKQDWEIFEIWRTGKTGFPLVDASMRELAATGFMSNRGRQNVASFLTKNLGINWQMGAEWFESQLIDYDVCNNWGNWNYTAGVGNDSRGFRFFNILKQSQDYDPDGNYVKHWLPELTYIPAEKIHEPWKLSEIEQQKFQMRLGVDYPHSIVNLFQSAKENEKIYNNALSQAGGSAQSYSKKPRKR